MSLIRDDRPPQTDISPPRKSPAQQQIAAHRTAKAVASRDLTLATARHEDLDPITAIQSFYLLVEAVARARSQDPDPDRPRHLSKVTSTR
jgi:fructoselysine-6-P-deglycase FrlB-like protein